jgi:acetylglutamate synthase
MRAIARTITVMAAALMIAAVPVLAEEGVPFQTETGSMSQQEESVNNRECLLVAQNCPTESIQNRIDRIQTEIGRGSSVYSNDELNTLRQELEDNQQLLNSEMSGGA